MNKMNGKEKAYVACSKIVSYGGSVKRGSSVSNREGFVRIPPYY